MTKTKSFYARYGGKTIILARFVPIVRTFAPFVAGVGRMDYSRFALFNVAGALLWTAIFTGKSLHACKLCACMCAAAAQRLSMQGALSLCCAASVRAAACEHAPVLRLVGGACCWC